MLVSEMSIIFSFQSTVVSLVCFWCLPRSGFFYQPKAWTVLRNGPMPRLWRRLPRGSLGAIGWGPSTNGSSSPDIIGNVQGQFQHGPFGHTERQPFFAGLFSTGRPSLPWYGQHEIVVVAPEWQHCAIAVGCDQLLEFSLVNLCFAGRQYTDS